MRIRVQHNERPNGVIFLQKDNEGLEKRINELLQMDFEEGGSTKWLLDPGCDHWIMDIFGLHRMDACIGVFGCCKNLAILY